MTRRCLPTSSRPSSTLIAGLALALSPVACSYEGPAELPSRDIRVAPLPQASKGATSKIGPKAPDLALGSASDSADQKERREAILGNVINLIQTAAITPGGKHFEIATRNLNQYFDQGIRAGEMAMNPATRQFLATVMPAELIREAEDRAFALRDARHIEDCMLYNEIVTRVAGEGDDLTRVRRVFDWMVSQVQLVPPGSLAPTGMEQAQARPYDVLLRGMATESQGYWTERGWLFMALCRQLGIDVGLVVFTPRPPPALLAAQPVEGSDQPVAWICAALIDDKAYLFDQRLGVAIPDASGEGVATLDEALADRTILDRMDVPGGIPYGVTRDDLLGSPSKIGILIDSSRGYFSPKMRMLQARLTGKDRTILYKDPAEQGSHFARVLGARAGAITFWTLPLQVETLLFTNATFVQSTQMSLRLFSDNLPLLYARMAQLKGKTDEAIRQYVAFRLVTGAVMRDKKTPIVPVLQRELDLYATYFLGLAHLETGNPTRAEFSFKQTLAMTPEPGPNTGAFCEMFRWGAQSNLGQIAAGRRDVPLATAYLSAFIPTFQQQGNLWSARELVFRDPASGVPQPLPPAPERKPTPTASNLSTNP